MRKLNFALLSVLLLSMKLGFAQDLTFSVERDCWKKNPYRVSGKGGESPMPHAGGGESPMPHIDLPNEVEDQGCYILLGRLFINENGSVGLAVDLTQYPWIKVGPNESKVRIYMIDIDPREVVPLNGQNVKVVARTRYEFLIQQNQPVRYRIWLRPLTRIVKYEELKK